MDVKFKFDLGARVRCTRSGIFGNVDGLIVYTDGTRGVCIMFADQTGSLRYEWRNEILVEPYSGS